MIQASKEERLEEAFGASTAAFIQPINKIVYRDDTIRLKNTAESKYISYLNKLISDTMTGPDTHDWVFPMTDFK